MSEGDPGVARRDFLRSTVIGAAGMLLGSTACSTITQSGAKVGEKGGAVGQGRPNRPNILLVTTDDQGLQAGCYGDPYARTPAMDRLAAQGVRFTRAYVTQPSCSASRSSMLTGLYPHQNGQIGLAHAGYAMHDGIDTLPAMLKREGYRTGILGKLHVSPENVFPFDFSEMRVPTSTRSGRGVAEQATRFFTSTPKDEPFFLYVNFFDPHEPHLDQFEGIPQKPLSGADVKPFSFMGYDTPEARQKVASYYNCVERADAGLGMLLDALQQAGHAEDTLVIVIGDNGPGFSRGKITCYEGGIRVPLIVRWPGKTPAGHEAEGLVSAVDLVPTLMEAVGARAHEGLAGASLMPLLMDKQPAAWRQSLFAESTAHGVRTYFPVRTVRDERYKLILNLLDDRPNPAHKIDPAMDKALAERLLHPPRVELYDLVNDPDEFKNLAGQEAYREIEARLLEELESWRKQTQDRTLDPDYLQYMTRKHDDLPKSGPNHWPNPQTF